MTAVDMSDLGCAELLDFAPLVEELDEEPEGERDPKRAAWLRRRGLGFGASEIAPLMVALGMRDASILASYQRPMAHPIRIKLNKRDKAVAVPRILLRKAGLRRPLKMADTARLGIEREPYLVAQWRRLVERGHAGADAELIDAARIKYMPELDVAEILPLRDSEEPLLCCTPDVLAHDIFGELGCWDAKCSHDPYHEKYRGPPECQRIQVNAQMAVCSATHGGIVEGECWSATFRDHAGQPSGPIRTWGHGAGVRRDEALVDEIRRAARLGWEKVLELRETARREG